MRVSGYILLEEKTSDRQYQTWFNKVQAAICQMGQGLSIKSLVSDRAKALIQLAVKGLDCLSLPDLFHAMRCLSRAIGSRLGGKLARTKRQLQQAQRQRIELYLKGKPIPMKLSQRLCWLQEQYNFIYTGVESYRHILHQISLIVHPFAVNGSGFQTTVDVAKALRELLPILAALGQTYQLSKIQTALEQFSHQILGIAAGINFWWQSIEQSLLLEEVDLVTENWLLGSLLPEVYWLSQLSGDQESSFKRGLSKGLSTSSQKTTCS